VDGSKKVGSATGASSEDDDGAPPPPAAVVAAAIAIGGSCGVARRLSAALAMAALPEDAIVEDVGGSTSTHA
jgi:hypothetical protein